MPTGRLAQASSVEADAGSLARRKPASMEVVSSWNARLVLTSSCWPIRANPHHASLKMWGLAQAPTPDMMQWRWGAPTQNPMVRRHPGKTCPEETRPRLSGLGTCKVLG